MFPIGREIDSHILDFTCILGFTYILGFTMEARSGYLERIECGLDHDAWPQDDIPPVRVNVQYSLE